MDKFPFPEEQELRSLSEKVAKLQKKWYQFEELSKVIQEKKLDPDQIILQYIERLKPMSFQGGTGHKFQYKLGSVRSQHHLVIHPQMYEKSEATQDEQLALTFKRFYPDFYFSIAKVSQTEYWAKMLDAVKEIFLKKYLNLEEHSLQELLNPRYWMILLKPRHDESWLEVFVQVMFHFKLKRMFPVSRRRWLMNQKKNWQNLNALQQKLLLSEPTLLICCSVNVKKPRDAKIGTRGIQYECWQTENVREFVRLHQKLPDLDSEHRSERALARWVKLKNYNYL